MAELNETHDANRRSWVESANDSKSDFPIQNLPFGVFQRRESNEEHRIGVAIGDQILDVQQAVKRGLLQGLSPECGRALCESSLNQFMAMDAHERAAARKAIGNFLGAKAQSDGQRATPQAAVLVSQDQVEMVLSCNIGDYTDFYASIHHAHNVGSMFRPDNPLLPNYKYLPVGYHGRASSIVISATPIHRPMGQIVSSDAGPPTFEACKLLDYEMELGFFAGPGNVLGRRIAMQEAPNHIFGMVIVNDWSARDIQKWEYQPLGPFNAKNFGTTISPWVVTMDALEPYRVPGPQRGSDDPQVLDYLKPARDMAFDITVEVRIASQQMRDRGMEPALISRGNFKDMYWTIAQMLVHHTSTGCNLRSGDLLASGTISGPTEDSRGCLIERTWRGQHPISLPDGTQRKFLQDGDEVIMTAYCEKPGFARIGFGECRGIVMPAH